MYFMNIISDYIKKVVKVLNNEGKGVFEFRIWVIDIWEWYLCLICWWILLRNEKFIENFGNFYLVKGLLCINFLFIVSCCWII